MALLPDPSLQSCAAGDSLCLVVHISSVQEGISLGRTVWHDEPVRILTQLQAGTWTFYHVVVDKAEPGCFVLRLQTETVCILRPPTTPSSFRIIRETCSGMGGISTGASFLGFHTPVFNDRSDLACQAVILNGGKAIQGDIADMQVVSAMHNTCPDSIGLLAAGFPRQPYSVQGDRGGLRDARGGTLGHVLRAAWLLQADGLVLENVTEVTVHQDTMDVLASFAARMQFRPSSCLLELADQWPCRRHRWWQVMLPAHLPPLNLQAWQALPTRMRIRDIIPEWPIWPVEEEANLTWTPEKSSMYNDAAYGHDSRRFDQDGIAPTALHSVGNALTACPCGCRQQAFSKTRLLQGGIRGQGVVSACTGQVRFAHPAELGLLQAIPPKYSHVQPPRHALCRIGQVASPLQALWIVAQIQSWIDRLEGRLPVDPVCALEGFKRMLLQQRRDLWITPAMSQVRFLQVQVAGQALSVKVTAPTTVRQLVQAEHKLAGYGLTQVVCQAGAALDEEAQLHAEIVYEVRKKPRLRLATHCLSRNMFQSPTLHCGGASRRPWLLPALLATPVSFQHPSCCSCNRLLRRS